MQLREEQMKAQADKDPEDRIVQVDFDYNKCKW